MQAHHPVILDFFAYSLPLRLSEVCLALPDWGSSDWKTWAPGEKSLQRHRDFLSSHYNLYSLIRSQPIPAPNQFAAEWTNSTNPSCKTSFPSIIILKGLFCKNRSAEKNFEKEFSGWLQLKFRSGPRRCWFWRCAESSPYNWSHDNLSPDNWSHDSWSHDNWSHNNWSHDNRSHDNWSHNNLSHDNWSHDNWSSIGLMTTGAMTVGPMTICLMTTGPLTIGPLTTGPLAFGPLTGRLGQ